MPWQTASMRFWRVIRRHSPLRILLLVIALVLLNGVLLPRGIGVHRFPYPLRTGFVDSAAGDEEINQCFVYGTNFSASHDACVCLRGWFGSDCSVPKAIWETSVSKEWHAAGRIRRRSRPRTVVNAFIINHEMDLLEIRVRELNDAVDYFLVCEANYTFFGAPKPLHLRSMLSGGFLSAYRSKIVVVTAYENHVTDGNPWAPENYFRTFVWQEGRHRLKNLRDDDLFMINDADEIPSRDVMLFLKHHDGYGEPIAFGLRWFLYGFFWENRKPVVVSGACSVAYLREVYQDTSLFVRGNEKIHAVPVNGTGMFAFDWTITGVAPQYAGWHCSWCFDIPGIQVKLASSQRDDGVRWGDLPEKYNQTYIKWLRKTGKFFDNGVSLLPIDGESAAPDFVRRDSNRWKYLLYV